MNFGEAIKALKANKKVARQGWNGKGMYIYKDGAVSPDLVELENPYITMWTAQNVPQKGWLASQADIFAEDWQIINN